MLRTLELLIINSFEVNQGLGIKKSVFTVAKDLPKKNGFVKGVQRYKCSICKKQFLGGERINRPC